jgi:RNA polymerase sigma factor (sigma-70 family)
MANGFPILSPALPGTTSSDAAGKPGHASFACFYRDAKDAVYQAVLLAGRHPARAEDAAQEAFAKAYVRWDEVGTYANPVGWVVRVALNEARSAARVFRRERSDPPDLTATPDVGPLDRELVRLVWRLPARQRQVIALRILLELSTEEAARALGISPGTVTAHLHRALTTLRSQITDGYGRQLR